MHLYAYPVIFFIFVCKRNGKSTLLKAFLGEIKPDVGWVARMGDYKYPTLQSAYVPQESHYKEKELAVACKKLTERCQMGLPTRAI